MISSSTNDLSNFPIEPLKAEVSKDTIKVTFNNKELSGKIFHGTQQAPYAVTKRLFTKYMHVNVHVGNTAYPILVKKKDLQEKLNISEQELDTFVKTGDGTLASLVRQIEIKKVQSVMARTQSLATGKFDEQGDSAHITLKSPQGKLIIYKDLNEEIGRGSSKVVSLYAKVSGKAFKLIALAQVIPAESKSDHTNRIQDARREVTIGRKLYNKYREIYGKENIPFLKYRTAIDQTTTAIPEFGVMMDHCETNLKAALPNLSSEQKGEIFLGILNGVAFMHSEGYVHRDLKPANIMLKGMYNEQEQIIGYQPKIIDFGISRRIEDMALIHHFSGSRAYGAPETFLRKLGVDDPTKLDSWSLGVILYEMKYGDYPPFKASIDRFVAKKASKEEVVEAMLELHLDDSDEINRVILGLLNVDPESRWTPDAAYASLMEIKEKSDSVLLIS